MNYLDITTARSVYDIADLPIRYPGHPLYDEEDYVASSIRDVVVGMVEMILFTNKGEVLAQPDFGADLERLLWNTAKSADQIKDELVAQIAEYIPTLDQSDYLIEVEIFEGELRDIMEVHVTLYDETITAKFI